MIRMGRSSRPEPPDTTNYQTNTPNPTPAYSYGTDSSQSVSRPATDSETIARDIKEGRLSGFVGHGTTLTGETSFQMMLRVDGHLTGTVSSEGGTLLVGTNGQVDANVSVGVAQINGTVNGDIVATEKIHLGRTAQVIGNIATPKLVIEDGAAFEGSCSMLKARENQEQQLSAAQEQYRAAEASRYEAAVAASSSEDEVSDEYLGAALDESEEEDEEEAAV
jgi:cytoskeletal protein CcmA (bactofilin family)